MDFDGILSGKSLMITGGTGTLGNALVDSALEANFGELVIFSRDEEKQDEMRRRVKGRPVRFVLGDVRNFTSVLDAMRGVDMVVHAAALKQVPSCESFPREAISTNTLGSDNVMEAAFAADVRKVVLLSTDKAVYPINAMGMSKALMEKCMMARARTRGPNAGTVLCATRYGNVLGSRGSVVPLFLDQIVAGQPLTITDPEMTRFVVTANGALALVLTALGHGKPGDLFVQKAPATTIGTIARALLRLMHAENKIEIIGPRPGEKVYETLLNCDEYAIAEDWSDCYRIPLDGQRSTEPRCLVARDMVSKLDADYTSRMTRILGVEEMMALLAPLACVHQALREGCVPA
jgi:UDP-N-acetylglucosamine 4,6-dehydratase/5-epimerase